MQIIDFKTIQKNNYFFEKEKLIAKKHEINQLNINYLSNLNLHYDDLISDYITFLLSFKFNINIYNDSFHNINRDIIVAHYIELIKEDMYLIDLLNNINHEWLKYLIIINIKDENKACNLSNQIINNNNINKYTYKELLYLKIYENIKDYDNFNILIKNFKDLIISNINNVQLIKFFLTNTLSNNNLSLSKLDYELLFKTNDQEYIKSFLSMYILKYPKHIPESFYIHLLETNNLVNIISSLKIFINNDNKIEKQIIKLINSFSLKENKEILIKNVKKIYFQKRYVKSF